jgi:hypothetical protein
MKLLLIVLIILINNIDLINTFANSNQTNPYQRYMYNSNIKVDIKENLIGIKDKHNNKPLLMMHIPKTACTSLKKELKK